MARSASQVEAWLAQAGELWQGTTELEGPSGPGPFRQACLGSIGIAGNVSA